MRLIMPDLTYHGPYYTQSGVAGEKRLVLDVVKADTKK